MNSRLLLFLMLWLPLSVASLRNDKSRMIGRIQRESWGIPNRNKLINLKKKTNTNHKTQEGKHWVHLPVGGHIQDLLWSETNAYCIHWTHTLHIPEAESKDLGSLQWPKPRCWNVNQFLKICPHCQKRQHLTQWDWWKTLFYLKYKKPHKSLRPSDGNILPAHLLRPWDKWNKT